MTALRSCFGAFGVFLMVLQGCRCSIPASAEDSPDSLARRLPEIQPGMDYDTLVDLIGVGTNVGFGNILLIYDWGQDGHAYIACGAANKVTGVDGWYLDEDGVKRRVEFSSLNKK